MKNIILFVLASAVFFAPCGAEKNENKETLPVYHPPIAPLPADWPDQRLREFAAELADYVFTNHVVTDPCRITYGMPYEFYADGKQMQSFGLDTMHDGAWFTAACVAADIADPEIKYLERAAKYTIPFYANVINNSDKIFPDKKFREGQDKKPLEEPLKGWVPRGWDDGRGYMHGKDGQFNILRPDPNSKSTTVEMKDGRFIQAYYTPSNHLAQDLAVMLTQTWLVTKDPALAAAMKNIYQYRTDYFGPIPLLETAFGITSGKTELIDAFSPGPFDPAKMRVYKGAYLQQDQNLDASYSDVLEWHFDLAAARYCVTGKSIPEEYILHAAARINDAMSAMEIYFDDRPWPAGMFFFDIQDQPRFCKGTGKLSQYMSKGGLIFGARGIQFAAVASGILPKLKKNPEIWQSYYEKNHADENLVRIVNNATNIDGKKDTLYDKTPAIVINGTIIRIVSNPKNLCLYVETADPGITFKIAPAAENITGDRRIGKITVSENGSISVTNDKGESLRFEQAFTAGSRWAAEIKIPYTFNPGQKQWINASENTRFTLSVNDNQAYTLYMLSEPQRIIDRLECLCFGAVETWYKVYRTVGRIPSGWRTHNVTVEVWEVSDVGNYAHLIKTIAQILIDRQKSSYPEMLKKAQPQKPLDVTAMPKNYRPLQHNNPD